MLTLLEGNAAIPDLVNLLATAPEGDQERSKAALLDLDASRVGAAIETHLQSLHGAGEPDQKEAMRWLDVLARLRGSTGRLILKRVLNTGNPTLRLEALRALREKVGTGSLVEPFLTDPQLDVAVAAANALSFPASDTALAHTSRRSWVDSD